MSIHPFLHNYPTEGGRYPLPYFANPSYLNTERGQEPMALFQPGAAPVQYHQQVDGRIQSAVAYIVSDFINTVMLKSNNNATYQLLYAMLRYNQWNNNTTKLLLDIFFRNVNNSLAANPSISVVEAQARTRRYIDTFLDAARAFTYWYYVQNSGPVPGASPADHQEMIEVLEQWNVKEQDAYGRVTFTSQKQQQSVYATNQYQAAANNSGGYYDAYTNAGSYSDPSLAYNPYGVNNNGFVTDSAVTKPVGDPVRVRYPDPVPEAAETNSSSDDSFVGFIPMGTFTPSRREPVEPAVAPVTTQQYPSTSPVVETPVEASNELETGITENPDYNRWHTTNDSVWNPSEPTIRRAYNPRTHRRRVLRHKDTGFTKEDFLPMDYNQHAIESVRDLAVVEGKREEMSEALGGAVSAEAARQEITRLAPTDKPFKNVVIEKKAAGEVFHDSNNYANVLNLRSIRFNEEEMPDVYVVDAIATSSFCHDKFYRDYIKGFFERLSKAERMEDIVKAVINATTNLPINMWSAVETSITSLINSMINQRTGLENVYIESICVDWYDLRDLLNEKMGAEFVSKFSAECLSRSKQLFTVAKEGDAAFEMVIDDLIYRMGLDEEDEEAANLRETVAVYQQLQTVAVLNINSSDLPVDLIHGTNSVALGIVETNKYIELYHELKERNKGTPVFVVTKDGRVFEMSTSLHDGTSVLMAPRLTSRQWDVLRMQQVTLQALMQQSQPAALYPTN